MAKYKITGSLNCEYYNQEFGEYIQVKKTLYARFRWTLKIKVFYMKIFYDWVEVKELES